MTREGLATPALVVGLGRFGASVARRLATEAADAFRRPEQDPEARAWAERVRTGGLDLVLSEGDEDPDHVAARVMARAREVLAHERLSKSRDAPGRDGPTRFHVLVLAHLGEPGVRARVGPVLRRIGGALLRELGPIFERFRTRDRRHLVVLPLLAMPHPAAFEDGAEVATTVRELCAQVAATTPRERAVPQVFVIEDVAEFTVLSEPELAQCVRNFATLLLHGLGALPDDKPLLYGRNPEQPLASFACAVAELPRRKLRRYGSAKVALEILDAIADAPREDEALEKLDVLEEVELAALSDAHIGGGDGAGAEADVREVIERYAPSVERDEEPRWWVHSEVLRERYGPDAGDGSRASPQPPPEPPVGWALARMEAISEGWRKLQRRRFDDLIARERRAVEQTRDALLDRMGSLVDRTLWAEPTPESFRRADGLVEKMRRAVDDELESAVAKRDAIEPPPAPSFDAFREAHAGFMDAARGKPDLGRMALFGGLGLLLFVLFGPLLLGALADAWGLRPGGVWYEPWLRQRAPITSALLFLLLPGSGMAMRLSRSVAEVRERYHAMWNALEETVTGARGSVLDYFASRLRLARQVARVEALLGLQAALRRDAERLTLMDRAIRRARAELLDEQRRLGVRRDARGEDLTGLLSSLDAEGVSETLVEPLVGEAALAKLSRALPVDAQRARIVDALEVLAREEGAAKRWREEVPFTDLEALREICAPHAEPIMEWDPFADPETAEDAAERIAGFVRRQARSLQVALNYSGHESRDPSGVSELVRGEAIVPPACFEGVRRRLSDEGAAGRLHLPVRMGDESDRAYYVVAVGDIAERAAESLTPPAEKPLRFEVEGDA